ncbi:MarR family transcriptional regulator [Phycicoccus sp.]|uniref:MarR family winged helix-turn-helix transcriptional regulator n=1 Tax=Phycicoccus sp. TaxID=1902410 RepID=UPI002CDB8B3C|nr:MarR family transcriptional regulator [Phycicoccus sp.]HMM95703.1 MarR family transcriptional regulator [Phycicoccus sp.]
MEPTPAAGAPRRRSPTWTRRRGIAPAESAEHSPWLRLHEHLAVRHGIRADLPRRWERPDADDPRNLPALLRQASAQVDADLARALADLAPGLTPDGLDVLRRLRDKRSTGVHLAEYLGRSEARVSRLLASLAERGLVHREPSWRDLRSHRAELTDEGRRMVSRLEPRLDELLESRLEGLEDVERRALRLVLQAVADRPPRRPRRAPRPAPPHAA